LCGRAIGEGDDVTTLGPLVDHSASTSPLAKFSEGIFHTRCLEADPLGPAALSEQEERIREPKLLRCSLCGKLALPGPKMATPERVRFMDEELVGVPLDAAIPTPFAPGRYLQMFHRACLEEHGRASELVESVERLQERGWPAMESAQLWCSVTNVLGLSTLPEQNARLDRARRLGPGGSGA
jgi:hypothetical protein